MLSWVAFSVWPLTISELLCALTVDPGDKKFNEYEVSLERDVTALCAGLVVIDQISGVVCLVHPTMQTYFNNMLKSDLRFSETLAKMVGVCLTCVSFNSTNFAQDSDTDGNSSRASSDEPDDSSSIDGQSVILDASSSSCDLANALDSYAIRYWADHALHDSHSENSSATTYITSFLCNTMKRNVLVDTMYWYNVYPVCIDVTGLHVAAKFGLMAVAKALLGMPDCDINAQDGAGNSALSLAIDSGQEELLIFFVDAGATIDLLQQSRQTMLIIAVEKDFKELASRILQTAGKTPQTTLLSAAYNEQDTEIAQILQHPDLDLEYAHRHFGVTALLVAVECRNDKVIQALLKRGVDVDTAGGNGPASLALHRAAKCGSVKIVELLLENKATVDLKL